MAKKKVLTAAERALLEKRLDEMIAADFPESEIRKVEEQLLEQTDNSARPEDGPQPEDQK